MSHDALADFLNDGSFKTPAIKSKKFPTGKVYTIESPDAETGIRLTGLANIAAKAAQGMTVEDKDVSKISMDDDEERNFMQQVLGSTYEEMIEDGVPWVTIQRLNQYAFAYFAVSPQAATRGVESGAFAGKATENRAQRRAKKKATTPTPAQASPGSKKAKAQG